LIQTSNDLNLIHKAMAPPPVLPEELVALILGNLDPKQDSKTMHALRICNKMFSRLATPYMYRKINIGMATPRNGMNFEDASNDKALVDQLIENTELTNFVKEVHIQHRSVGIKDEEREARKKVIEADDEDVEVAITNALKHADRDDARVAFLLWKCRDLEVVRSAVAFNSHGKLVRRLLTSAGARHLQARLDTSGKKQPPDFLGSVREVTMNTGMAQNSVEDARTLLCLPALQTLRLGDLADNHFFKERQPPPHDNVIRNTNPVHLIFDMCMMSPGGLDTILQTSPNATSLTLRWRPGLWNDHWVNSEFCNLLRERGQNLERIHFDCTSVLEHRYSMPPIGPYGSFASLNAKWFAVPRAFFVHLFDLPVETRPAQAAALLPKGLRELYVIGVEEKEMADMYAIIGKDALGETMEELEISVCVPWFHFYLEEYAGRVHHRNVDYDKTGGFEVSNMS
jgi:hypothetical protein